MPLNVNTTFSCCSFKIFPTKPRIFFFPEKIILVSTGVYHRDFWRDTFYINGIWFVALRLFPETISWLFCEQTSFTTVCGCISAGLERSAGMNYAIFAQTWKSDVLSEGSDLLYIHLFYGYWGYVKQEIKRTELINQSLLTSCERAVSSWWVHHCNTGYYTRGRRIQPELQSPQRADDIFPLKMLRWSFWNLWCVKGTVGDTQGVGGLCLPWGFHAVQTSTSGMSHNQTHWLRLNRPAVPPLAHLEPSCPENTAFAICSPVTVAYNCHPLPARPWHRHGDSFHTWPSHSPVPIKTTFPCWTMGASQDEEAHIPAGRHDR